MIPDDESDVPVKGENWFKDSQCFEILRVITLLLSVFKNNVEYYTSKFLQKSRFNFDFQFNLEQS